MICRRSLAWPACAADSASARPGSAPASSRSSSEHRSRRADRRGKGAIRIAELQPGIAPPDRHRQSIEHGAQPFPLALSRVARRTVGKPHRITAIARESRAAEIDRRTALGQAQPQSEASAIGAQPCHGAVERGDVARLKAVEKVGEAARRGAERAQRAGEEALAAWAEEIKRGRAAAERRAELVEARGQVVRARQRARQRASAWR